MEDVFNGKTSFMISGEMSSNFSYNSVARHLNFHDELKQNYPTLKVRQRYLDCCHI